jgi:deazaflavin-dependent oxidoreductase (nitroreductase family)
MMAAQKTAGSVQEEELENKPRSSPSDAREIESIKKRSAPQFHNWMWRAGDGLAIMFARAGIGPIQMLLTTGRYSGRVHTNPVVPVEHMGKTWLVAPYGVVSWVLNARAARAVALRFGRTTRRYEIREASLHEAAPVLKRYVEIASKTRPYFQATKDSPVEDFLLEAACHPVFELIPLDNGASKPR